MSKGYWGDNWKRSRDKWSPRRAAILFFVTLPLLAVNLFNLPVTAKLIVRALPLLVYVILALYLAWLLFYGTPKLLWESAQQEVQDLNECLKPKLELVFEEGKYPYVDERFENPFTVMIHKVGIMNPGAEPIVAELVLENAEPRVRGIFPGTALGIIDEGVAKRNALERPSGDGGPTKFAGVVLEDVDSDGICRYFNI